MDVNCCGELNNFWIDKIDKRLNINMNIYRQIDEQKDKYLRREIYMKIDILRRQID